MKLKPALQQLKKIKPPYATLFIATVLVAAYFFLSGGQPYIHPIESIDSLGVSSQNILGAVPYSFVHIGLKHLIGNVVVLLFIGTVLEQRIKPKHALGIYLATGILAGIGNAIIHPDTWAVGASAAVTGLVTAAYVVDIKKASIALVAGMVLVALVLFPATDFTLNAMQETKAAGIAVQVEKMAGITTELSVLEQKVLAGTATGEEVMRQQALSVESEARQQQIQKDALEKEGVDEGRHVETITPVSTHIHILGILVALAYLAVVKPTAFQLLRRDAKEMLSWVK